MARVANGSHSTPAGAKRDLSTRQAAALLRLIRPLTPIDDQRKALARDLLADLKRLDTVIKTTTKTIQQTLDAAATTLTDIHGLGPVLAAKILAHSGDISSFPNRHHYASYSGTAPSEASSGEMRRHRLSRAGNRQLNAAIQRHRRLPSPRPRTRTRPLPPQTRRSEPVEARRRLKRQLSNVIYKRLLVDHQTAFLTTT